VRARLRVFATVLRDRALVRIELAFLLFNMAEYATWIAIFVFAYARAGAVGTAIVALVQLLPPSVIAPLAAYAGDRFRRDHVLVVSYLTQALTLALAAAALLADAPLWVVYVAAAASSTSMTFTRPAQAALLPALTASPADLTAANVTSGVVEGAGIMLGPFLAGLVLAGGQVGTVYAIFAVTALVAAALVSRLPVDPGAVTPAVRLGSTNAWRETLGGISALGRDRGALTIVTLLAAAVTVVGALDVLFVAVAIDLIHTGEGGAGFLSAAFGAGGIVGAAATVVLVGRRRLTPPLAGGTALFGIPVGAVAAVDSAVTAPVLFAVAGAGRSVADVAGRTLLQRIAPDEVLTRVFGVLEGMTMLALALGSVAASGLIEAFGVRMALVVTGAFVPVVAVLTTRRLLAIDRGAEAPDPDALELLRGLPIFAPLPPAAIERLLREVVRTAVEPGVSFIRQDDVGDRFYIVIDGEADVRVDGEPIATVRRGDGVGEIALLRDAPRMATVTALTPMHLLTLEREAFLEAVTGYAQSRRVANALVEERLAATARG
jgi:MFS family permease